MGATTHGQLIEQITGQRWSLAGVVFTHVRQLGTQEIIGNFYTAR